MSMYMRGVKVTFTNELMKNAVLTFLSQQLDLTNGMMMTFRCHLSENQILNIMVFPDKDKAVNFAETAKSYAEQIKSMGAKLEVLHGEISHFGIAGEVTIDQLRG